MTIKVTKGKKPEYSKRLVSDIRSLLWVVTVGGLLLAAYCIHKGYTGSLPWLSAMVGLPWTAHGVVCSFYLNMAKSDHRAGGVTFESAVKTARVFDGSGPASTSGKNGVDAGVCLGFISTETGPNWRNATKHKNPGSLTAQHFAGIHGNWRNKTIIIRNQQVVCSSHITSSRTKGHP